MENIIDQKWTELSKCINEFELEYHRLANYYKLSDSSFWTLYELYCNEDGCTQKELYTDWCLNKQTINSSVKALTKEGYIKLEYLDDSKKFKKLKLTEKGKEIAKNTVGKVIELEKEVFKKTDEKEMEMVINFFKNQTTALKNKVNIIIEKRSKE